MTETSRPLPPPPRAVVDAVLPEVDAGRYPAKGVAGDTFEVTVHAFADGHDELAVRLLHRRAGDIEWCETPMSALGNDEWRASFTPDQLGCYEYTAIAWVDRFGTWLTDLRRRVEAGWDVEGELLEGAALLAEAAERGDQHDRELLLPAATWLRSGELDVPQRLRVASDAALAEGMARTRDRSADAAYARVLSVWVDRPRARFGSWYEMFPRSETPDPTRSATFREAARRLPDIASMGFDVLYLPPVHPIGVTERKGPNNTLGAQPGDPGSPWAIGSAEGGHTAVHPGLGTIADFDWFVAEARGHGLEVALDLAFQCSPDHPWVREHPQWFRHRPDGSIRYAENPPKRYQDIYPLDFDAADWEALWRELLTVTLFWVDHGVRIFRVDNPHTKPFRFWEWLIDNVRRQHPDAIFLAEAFTRPKRMAALAKLGFSQSYSYFTWRNTKAEIEDYFTELTRGPLRDYFRPNLFVNTPDILHEYLQAGGRPAFLARLALAATLGPTYGIYSGYELLERDPAHPGSEEYLDSEKYQLRPREWDAPHSIAGEITKWNRIRREHAALQYNHDLWFLPIANDQIVAYVKSSPDGRDRILTAVNLDPHAAQSGSVGLPLAALGLDEGAPFVVHELLSDRRYVWQGEWNYLHLDPARPAQVFAFEPPEGAPAAEGIRP